jgi:FtsH-binding integral membrane protein
MNKIVRKIFLYLTVALLAYYGMEYCFKLLNTASDVQNVAGLFGMLLVASVVGIFVGKQFEKNKPKVK